MNYKRIYDEIIENAKPRGLDKRKLDGYFEKHHIIPKCMKGTNDESNLVLLTGCEHYLAHYLLWKIYPDIHGLIYAHYCMTYIKDGYGPRNRYVPKLSARQCEMMKIAYNKNNPMMTQCFVYNHIFENVSAAKEFCKHSLLMSNKDIDAAFGNKDNDLFKKLKERIGPNREIISICDKLFNSRREAEEYVLKTYNVSSRILKHRLQDPLYKDWFIVEKHQYSLGMKGDDNGMAKTCYVDDIKFGSMKKAFEYTKDKYGMTYSSTIKAFNNKKKYPNFIKEHSDRVRVPWNKGIHAPQCANKEKHNNSRRLIINGIEYCSKKIAAKELCISTYKIFKMLKNDPKNCYSV